MGNSFPAPEVVVGVDGSRAAEQAVLWAIDEAVSRDIPMRLVYVVDPREATTANACEASLAAARTALADAHRSVEATGAPVKVETEILCGRPLAKLLEASSSAAMLCIGSIGLDHARQGATSVAKVLARSARCPVAVIRQPTNGRRRRKSTPCWPRPATAWCCGMRSTRRGCAEPRCARSGCAAARTPGAPATERARHGRN